MTLSFLSMEPEIENSEEDLRRKTCKLVQESPCMTHTLFGEKNLQNYYVHFQVDLSHLHNHFDMFM